MISYRYKAVNTLIIPNEQVKSALVHTFVQKSLTPNFLKLTRPQIQLYPARSLLPTKCRRTKIPLHPPTLYRRFAGRKEKKLNENGFKKIGGKFEIDCRCRSNTLTEHDESTKNLPTIGRCKGSPKNVCFPTNHFTAETFNSAGSRRGKYPSFLYRYFLAQSH